MGNAPPTSPSASLRHWLLHGVVGLCLLFGAFAMAEGSHGSLTSKAFLFMPFVAYLFWKGFEVDLASSWVGAVMLITLELLLYSWLPNSGWREGINSVLTIWLVSRVAKK